MTQRLVSVGVKVTVLVGGVGGARFLLGVQHLLGLGQFAGGESQDHSLSAIVNIGDDAWMFGVRICPDLDTCMYTLGGGIDPERGWGHRNETWHAKEELAAYGVQPDWFGLGDRDLATHLVRSQMLRAGYPLSEVTEALCKRWSPGAHLLPASDDRSETHVVITDPDTGERRAIHFQEWWVRYRAQVPTHSFAFVGADKATAGPGVADAIASADVVLLAPSNPGRQHRLHPRHPGHPRRTAVDLGARDRLLPHRRGKAVARHGRRVPLGDRGGEHLGGGRRLLRPAFRRRHPGRLAGARGRSRRDRRSRGAVGAAADDRPGDDGRNGPCRTRSGGGQAVTEHGSAAAIELLPVTGLPEFRPGDDLAAALAAAAPWLRDDDVVVVTSKVLSKCEGRIVPAPEDPEERDTLRRKLIDEEAVRVLARKGRTLITENNLGIVQAAAGVDGSNVGATELALLPVDPDGSAAALRAGLRERLGVTVGVVVTDTMGRAWRNGQIDAAIGAAGITVLHGYAGAHDVHGNELVVTEVAVADEIAAAADLVKGKLTGIPGRRGARTDAAGQRIQCPHAAAARRGGPVLARHGGGARDGPRPGAAAAPVGSAVQRRSPSRRRSSRPPSRRR